jgi:hypothetical protein
VRKGSRGGIQGDLVLTTHAAFEMGRRGLSEDLVRAVVTSPDQVLADRPGRKVFQSQQVDETSQKVYLVRVFVDVDRKPAEVVTAYRTSKVQKYWRQRP